MSRKNWISFKKGTNRTVLLIGDYALKTPVITNGHLLFLHGCCANYKERAYCKMMKNVENNKFYDLVAPSIFCSLFGLFQVQKRCDEVLFEMTEEQLSRFDTVRGGESKNQNFGFYEGRLVCLDYGD